MKKLFFSFILYLSFSNFLFGQQSPIIGYDKLEFGTTIEAFQKMYQTARETPSKQSSIGVREFRQSNVGSGIHERRFYFFNNRFYRVDVIYANLNVFSINSLLDKIIEVYGKFDRKEEDTDFSPAPDVSYTDKIFFDREYRKNFFIFVSINTNHFIDGSILNTVLVSYHNPITNNEVIAAEKKQAGSKLGL